MIPSANVFPVLAERLMRDKQVGELPPFLGGFPGVKGLPTGREYPLSYVWIDTTANALRISVNAPLLEKICVEECARHGGAEAADVRHAVDSMIKILTDVTARVMQKLPPGIPLTEVFPTHPSFPLR